MSDFGSTVRFVIDAEVVDPLHCRYKVQEVYESFYTLFLGETVFTQEEIEDVAAERDITIEEAKLHLEYRRMALAEQGAEQATKQYVANLPQVLKTALRSNFLETLFMHQFSRTKSLFYDELESGDLSQAERLARLYENKSFADQDCINFAAAAVTERIGKKNSTRRKDKSLAQALKHKREAAKMKRKIVCGIRRLLNAERRVPKKAAVARESGIHYRGNMTQALQDVLDRFGWSYEDLLQEAQSSDFSA